MVKSKNKIKNHVRFKGPFEKEFKDEFPGRDLAEFIAERLRQMNFIVNSVDCEEPFFSVKVVSGAIEYPLVVSHSGIEEDYWEISCPCTLGKRERRRGKSEEAEMQALITALDEIMHAENIISDIQWFGDYDDLLDGYAKTPAAKRMNVIWKYLEKMTMPVCLTGLAIAAIGGIYGGQESLLLRIGSIMFLMPIALWIGLFLFNLSIALFDYLKESFHKKTKEKWLRWLYAVFVLSVIIVPPFLVSSDNLSIDKLLFGFIAVVISCGVLFCLSIGIAHDLVKEKEKKKKLLLSIGLVLTLPGAAGFFGGVLSSLGVLKWLPQSVEFPLGIVEDIHVNSEGDLLVLSGFYGRVQVYDKTGDFVRGWFIYAPGGKVSLNITDNDEIEVAAFSFDKIYRYDKSGKLLKTDAYDDMYSRYSSEEQKHLFDQSTGIQYDVEGWVFPRIVQKGPDGERRIGKTAFYMLPFQGPVQAFAMIFTGMFFLSRAEKTKKKRKTNGKVKVCK